MSAFEVSKVALATKPHATVDQKVQIERAAGGRVEACSGYATKVLAVPHNHQLLNGVGIAFSQHYPLVLTPDSVWLTIAQGFAAHVTAHAEALRSRLVAHQGSVAIKIRRDDFVRGSPENDWAGAFSDFSAAIREHLGARTHSLVVADFSTTGPLERAASEVVLMDAVKSYFTYEVHTLCGIPSVELTGNVEDWERVRVKARDLLALCPAGDASLEWWAGPLDQVLEQFVLAKNGNVNAPWWRSIFNFENASGGPYVNGWILWLVPYVIQSYMVDRVSRQFAKRSVRNKLMGKFVEGWDGLTAEAFPGSLSRVPFVWEYLGKRFDYEFLAGITGVAQDATSLAVRSVCGWAVRPRA